MKKSCLIAILASTIPLAQADSTHECQGNSCNSSGDTYVGGQGGTGGNGGIGVGLGVGLGISHSTSNSSAGSSSYSESDSHSSASTGDSFSGGNTSQQTVNVIESKEHHYSGSYTAKFAPAAPEVIANPTAPCRVAVGVGGSWVGGSIGIGSSVLDDGCDTREDARLLFNMGLHDFAVMRLCVKPEMAKVISGCSPKRTDN